MRQNYARRIPVGWLAAARIEGFSTNQLSLIGCYGYPMKYLILGLPYDSSWCAFVSVPRCFVLARACVCGVLSFFRFPGCDDVSICGDDPCLLLDFVVV